MEFYENTGEPAGDPGLTFTAFTHTISIGNPVVRFAQAIGFLGSVFVKEAHDH
jgi:hypothetical protein